MHAATAMEQMLGWENDVIEQLVDQLNNKGIVSDEDLSFLSTWFIESWDDECEELLRKHGYKYGSLDTCAKFFDSHGDIYALFDCDSYDDELALAYLQKVANRPAS